MKYNQPYGGVADAPFVNGDPSIGRQGSIPPAEAIEYDQREIVNVIQWAADHQYTDMNGALCVAPTNTYLDQLLKALFGIFNSKLLRANATSYVNGSTGNDTTLDGTQATVSGTHGPFATIDRALTEMSKYNLAGYTYSVIVADGTYAKVGSIFLPLPNGSGQVVITGNTTTPTNCILSNTGTGSTVRQVLGGNYTITGFKMTNTSHANGDPDALIDTLAGNMTVGNFNCGTSVGMHFSARVSGFLFVAGPNITISGNAPGSHMYASEGGRCLCNVGDTAVVILVISGAVSIGTFCQALYASYARPIYLSITGAANDTGIKYNAQNNSIINVNGAGTNYLPGTVAGSVSTGGLYG